MGHFPSKKLHQNLSDTKITIMPDTVEIQNGRHRWNEYAATLLTPSISSIRSQIMKRKDQLEVYNTPLDIDGTNYRLVPAPEEIILNLCFADIETGWSAYDIVNWTTFLKIRLEVID